MPLPATLPPDWRATEFLPMEQAARVLAVSRAQLYRLAKAGDLKLKRNLGRTVVPTYEIVRLIRAAEPWAPSRRNAPALTALNSRRKG